MVLERVPAPAPPHVSPFKSLPGSWGVPTAGGWEHSLISPRPSNREKGRVVQGRALCFSVAKSCTASESAGTVRLCTGLEDCSLRPAGLTIVVTPVRGPRLPSLCSPSSLVPLGPQLCQALPLPAVDRQYGDKCAQAVR